MPFFFCKKGPALRSEQHVFPLSLHKLSWGSLLLRQKDFETIQTKHSTSSGETEETSKPLFFPQIQKEFFSLNREPTAALRQLSGQAGQAEQRG